MALVGWLDGWQRALSGVGPAKAATRCAGVVESPDEQMSIDCSRSGRTMDSGELCGMCSCYSVLMMLKEDAQK